MATENKNSVDIINVILNKEAIKVRKDFKNHFLKYREENLGMHSEIDIAEVCCEIYTAGYNVRDKAVIKFVNKDGTEKNGIN